MSNEADTCRRYVLPKLYEAGWNDDQISEQTYFTDGRIIPVGRKHRRRPGKRTDYLLAYRPDFRIAVIEAKAEYKLASDGLQKAMDYADILDLKFEILAGSYLKYFFLSLAGKGELWSRATGSTAIGIKASHLREIVLTVPPIAEQESIAGFLDRETTRIDALIAKIHLAIEKLREYRSALISAAVTGKIDVREEAFKSSRTAI